MAAKGLDPWATYFARADGPDYPAKAIVLTVSPDDGVIYSPSI
jgi:hypothetical protein